MSKHSPSKHFLLRNQVINALNDYFSKLEGEPANNIYELVLAEVEPPLLEMVMKYTNGNQTKAAEWLGLNRGTLRKLLAKYELFS